MSKRHPPWQWQVADYVVRDNGIFLRAFNVRLATFAPNSAALQSALSRMFDAAHVIVESNKTALEKLPKMRAGHAAFVDYLPDGYESGPDGRPQKTKPKSKTVMVRGKKHWRAAKEFRE